MKKKKYTESKAIQNSMEGMFMSIWNDLPGKETKVPKISKTGKKFSIKQRLAFLRKKEIPKKERDFFKSLGFDVPTPTSWRKENNIKRRPKK